MIQDAGAGERSRNGVAADAVQALERDLAARGPRRWVGRLLVLAGLAALVYGGYRYWESKRPPPEPPYATAKVELRDIAEVVQSTGKIKPLKEVQVGAQVSGRIVEVYVDFNSRVKKGDRLAEIDPQLFGTQVTQVRAQLEAAKANLKRAEANLASTRATLARLVSLRGEGIATPAEVEQAEAARSVADAEVQAGQAQLSQLNAQLTSAKTTLEYTQIFSPIDGIVINRAVDPGQTVAASLAAPVLFVIAQDLSRMQVMAEIDEADVGKLREGMEAEVVVDAFPGNTFAGKVSQIRYSPNDVQGVVTYSGVVDVANPDLKLRPGMTATVSITTNRAEKVAAVPNAALRFRPSPKEGEGDGPPKPEAKLQELKHGQGRLYETEPAPGADPVARVVEVGITDGVFSEVRGVEIGAEIVTEQRQEPKRKKFMGVF
jgi:HlyD family secretion protein